MNIKKMTGNGDNLDDKISKKVRAKLKICQLKFKLNTNIITAVQTIDDSGLVLW